MKVKFYPREAVIPETAVSYDIVVLEGVNEYYDVVGDVSALRRNQKLAEQLQAIKKWSKVPIVLLRIVSNAQWYLDGVKRTTDEPGWTELMNKLTLDATSAMIGVSRTAGLPVQGLIITAWQSNTVKTSSTWVKLTMQHLIDASAKWGLPIWAEFPTVIDSAWDAGQLVTYRDNIEFAEYATRPTAKPTLGEGLLGMPDNTVAKYFPNVTPPPVTPPASTDILLNVTPMSQIDPAWKDVILGTSNTTIGGYGCLVTCMAMLLKYCGYDADPIIVNEALRTHAGFSNGNLLMWGAVQTIWPNVVYDYRYDGARLDKIDAQLAKKMPVPVHVDYNPQTPAIEQHWVLIIGRQNGHYIIIDPRDGLQVNFTTRYGDPALKIYNTAVFNFTGTLPEPPVVTPPASDGLNEALVEIRRIRAILERVFGSGGGIA